MSAAPRRPPLPQVRWWEDTPPAPSFVCCDCRRSSHAASVVDPARCGDCARAHYAWRPMAGPIRRLRKVPPVEAARWDA